MALKSEQVVEIIKIIVGVVIAAVGGLWTYTTYTADERKAELQTLVALGDAIAGMHATCEGEFGQLAKLAELPAEHSNSRKKQCYDYFQDAYRRSFSAMITVRKPSFCPADRWASRWATLQNEIAGAGSARYARAGIEKAWTAILQEKGLRSKP